MITAVLLSALVQYRLAGAGYQPTHSPFAFFLWVLVAVWAPITIERSYERWCYS